MWQYLYTGYSTSAKCLVLLTHSHQASSISVKWYILPLTHCLIIDHKWQINKKPSHLNRVLPPQSLSTHALHYTNTLYEQTKCSAKHQNILSASIVSWLLKCAEQVIKLSHYFENKFEQIFVYYFCPII